MSGMLALPEGCIAAVISFTSPRDACRLACVSTAFRSAADSDVVWDHFLPPDYLSAISGPGSVSGSSSSTWLALSKKELYFRICHNLIHNGRMSFWFDLSSGKKCYMISARELDIDDGDNTHSWMWYSTYEAKFCEVLRRTGYKPFEVRGKISTSLLSPTTTYVAYLVFVQHSVFHGGDSPINAAVGLVGSNNFHNRTIYFPKLFPRELYCPGEQDEDDNDFFPKKRADG
ncbi:hypothetical protein Dsin_004489 [Dipteronia sinensis]|uniref:F-box domain-containing protein n=1 Tax=Dipteronia sinensis TaxID=43782 RepID=A0AAE0AV16_9ROSI|nr:hypothetical protein Dsin_004489 [Dipteronia sinensis]